MFKNPFYSEWPNLSEVIAILSEAKKNGVLL